MVYVEFWSSDDANSGMLSFEASMPFIYSKNKFQVIATPAYVLPQNLVKIENRPELTENGKNMFYTTLALKYTF